MVRLIMSGKGEGKTKQLMELMTSAAETENGCMVCIEAARSISFSLRHQTRMIDAGEYQLTTFDTLRGFLSGLYAGNYDISHIFIDDLCKIVKEPTTQDLEKLWKNRAKPTACPPARAKSTSACFFWKSSSRSRSSVATTCSSIFS